MTTVPAILAVAVTYGAASIAATQATFLKVAGAEPLNRDRRFQREAFRMVVTLVIASAGALLESREVAVLELVVFAVILAALASAIVGGTSAPAEDVSTVPFYLGIAGLALLATASLAQGLWPTLLWAVLCALPFGASAFFFPRASAIDDAIFAGIAGALMALYAAMFVIFLACLTSIGYANLRKRPSRGVRFYPYISGFLLVGIIIQFALAG